MDKTQHLGAPTSIVNWQWKCNSHSKRQLLRPNTSWGDHGKLW
jgi:hypothetical protein